MASTAAATEQLQGIDISKVLRSKGPIVSCVVLRAKAAENSGEKPSALTEEIKLDTTPKKAEVETVLGGPFTFVGQYHEEGIVLMAKRGCVFAGNDEEEEEKPSKPLNPHKLQPPFDSCRVYGDILVLKVADCEEDENVSEETPTPSVKTNDEFFLHYTKEEYLKFAARTDVVPPVQPANAEEEEEEEAEDDEEEEEENNEWSGGEGEEDEEDEEEVSEEEAQSAMMQLLMTTCLRKFQEENGRGPSTEELLALKSTIMAKLGIPSPEEEESGGNENEGGDTAAEEEKATESQKEEEAEQTSKRSADDATAEESEPVKKKVKFGAEEAGEEPIAVPAQ